MANNEEQLKKLAKVFNTDNVITSAEIDQVLVGIMTIMASFKKGNEDLNTQTKKDVADLLQKVIEQNDKMVSSMQDSLDTKSQSIVANISNKSKVFDEKIQEVQELIDALNTIELHDGIDADPEQIIAEVLTRIELPEYKETILDDGDTLVSKINDLPIDNPDCQIDASHIKNLPEFNPAPNGGGWRNLFQLHDVSIVNPQNGDVLTYNSTTLRWENDIASGGGGTPGGSTTQLQYNNAGAFGGISGATSNGTIVTLVNPLISGSTITTSTVNGVTLTTGGGTTTFLNANGTYSTPAGAGTVTSVSGTTNRITVATGTTTPVIDIAATYVGQSSITTLGTITTGVWNGTAIANANLANSSLTIGSTNIALGATSTTLAGLTSVTSTTFVGALTGNASTATALATGRTIAITGDLAYTSPSFDGSGNVTAAGTLATVNSNVGTFGSATQSVQFTVNGKGLITAAANVTVTPAVGSITGLGTGVATFLATPSSANLIAAVTDETGSGALVFATSPTLVTPALGTPSALVGTNITGTGASFTSGITNALASATTTVNVSSATAPSANQALVATSSTTATWQTLNTVATWTTVTTTSQTAAVNNGYITNNAGLVTVTLPTTAAVGSVVEVAGQGAGGWKVAQNASGIIHFNSTDTTTGTGGSLASTNRYGSVRLLCIVANNEWLVLSSEGNITIV